MAGKTYSAAENFRGCLFMLLAMASFAIGDAILKHVSDHLPLSQILVVRGAFAATILGLLTVMLKQTRPIRTIANPAFLLRLAGEVMATGFFLTALFNMPIANASAILQALPFSFA